MNDIVGNFREKTDKLFHKLEGYSPREIEEIVREEIQKILTENGITVNIMDVIISGSRCRGLEQPHSDLDIILFYSGKIREDVLFDILHEDRIWMGDVEVDINPISEGKTGTLTEYLPGVEAYLEKKRKGLQKKISVRDTIEEKKRLIVEEKKNETAISLDFVKSNTGCNIL